MTDQVVTKSNLKRSDWAKFSFIPDYILPVPDKTILANNITAFLHLVAAVPTMLVLVIGYRQQADRI